jgi:hypothetical protein
MFWDQALYPTHTAKMLTGNKNGKAATGKESKDDAAYVANTSAPRTPTHDPMKPFLVKISKIDSTV